MIISSFLIHVEIKIKTLHHCKWLNIYCSQYSYSDINPIVLMMNEYCTIFIVLLQWLGQPGFIVISLRNVCSIFSSERFFLAETL